MHSWTRPQLFKKHGRYQGDFDRQPLLKYQYPVGRPFVTIEKNTWQSSLFQDLVQSPTIIKVIAKFQHL